MFQEIRAGLFRGFFIGKNKSRWTKAYHDGREFVGPVASSPSALLIEERG